MLGLDWKVPDDASVTSVISGDVGDDEAYVLVYRQLDRGNVLRFNEPPLVLPLLSLL